MTELIRSSVDCTRNGNINKGLHNRSRKSSTASLDSMERIVREQNAERIPNEGGRGRETLKYGSEHVIKLFIPVSVCMLIVIISVKTIDFYHQTSLGAQSFIYTPFIETGTPGNRFLVSIANALIFMVFVIIMTIVLIVLYKYRCYKIIQAWLIITTIFLLFFFMFIYLSEVVHTANIVIDIITVAFIIWNVGVLGMLSIHWRSPLKLRQAYLVMISALMALIFYKFLPDWTGWCVLAIICLWDLFAVLAPFGPLRFLVRTAQKRNEPIFPSLIYSSGVLYSFVLNMADTPPPISAISRVESSEQNSVESTVHMLNDGSRNANGHPKGERSVKLGLGDFIFYSILICKASSSSDLLTVTACFMAILVGLSLTLLLLAICQKALPALPISISLGIVFYFATAYAISPFCSELSSKQIFL